jgi:hypothetical protein
MFRDYSRVMTHSNYVIPRCKLARRRHLGWNKLVKTDHGQDHNGQIEGPWLLEASLVGPSLCYAMRASSKNFVDG